MYNDIAFSLNHFPINIINSLIGVIGAIAVYAEIASEFGIILRKVEIKREFCINCFVNVKLLLLILEIVLNKLNNKSPKVTWR